MGYDVSQGLGDHDVTVDSVTIVDKDGDGANLVVSCRLKFENGEIGNKDLYPTKSAKAAAITRKSLKAMGFDVDMRGLDELMENPKLLAGAKIRVVVEESEWNGNISHRISWINAIPKPPSNVALKSLTSSLRNAKNDNATEEL